MPDDLQSLRRVLCDSNSSADVQNWIGSNLERIVHEVLERVVVQLEEPYSDDPSLSISSSATSVTYVHLFSIVEEAARWHHGPDDADDPFAALSESYRRWLCKRRVCEGPLSA